MNIVIHITRAEFVKELLDDGFLKDVTERRAPGSKVACKEINNKIIGVLCIKTGILSNDWHPSWPA